jgi:hypothetical protein
MLRAANSIADSKHADQPAAKSCSGLVPVPELPGRDSLTSRRPSELRQAGASACGVDLRRVQHFLKSVHSVLLHEEPRRLNVARSSIVIGIVRRPQIGELGKQIDVGPYLVPGHLPICEDCQEGVGGIVGERSAIARKGRRTRRVVGQHVGQQCSRHPPCFLRRIPTGVLQRMREDGDEAGIVRRLARVVSISLRADEKDRLRG